MHYAFRSDCASSSYPNHPGARAGSPETSHEAAETIAPLANGRRARILAVLKEHLGGLCSEQIGELTGLSRYAIRPRISELVALGEVERTYSRTINDVGSSVVIWRAVQ